MDLSGKKIGVFGLGVSGLAVLNFLQGRDLASLVIVNAGEPETWSLNDSHIKGFNDVKLFNQDVAAPELSQCDCVILSPGIPREHEVLKSALDNNVPLWNEVELAYRFFKGQIIAVTGTNGKTTTVSFLTEALRQCGKSVFLGGNIGVPFVKAISENNYDIAVLELSSFQCESLEEFKADAYLYLNLFENHGERYDDMNDYRLAKWQMIKKAYKDSYIICGTGSGDCPFEQLNKRISRYPDNWDEQFLKLFSKDEINVVGEHNRYNFYGAYQVYKSLGLDDLSFKKALSLFSGVEHRLERLEGDQVIFNDAKSTNELALKTAVKAVYDTYGKHILIMGGRKRHEGDLPTKEVVELLKHNCHKVLCIGESATDLINLDTSLFVDVKDIKGAKGQLDREDVVLFSPGYPSFDQFKNYIDRGQQFKKIMGDNNELR